MGIQIWYFSYWIEISKNGPVTVSFPSCLPFSLLPSLSPFLFFFSLSNVAWVKFLFVEKVKCMKTISFYDAGVQDILPQKNGTLAYWNIFSWGSLRKHQQQEGHCDLPSHPLSWNRSWNPLVRGALPIPREKETKGLQGECKQKFPPICYTFLIKAPVPCKNSIK